MAQIGLKYVVAAKYTDPAASGSRPTYADGFVVGKAIEANRSINSNNNPLYADNVQTETDVSFSDGTLTLNIADFGTQASDRLKVQSKLLGSSLSEADSSGDTPAILTRGGLDTVPYMGVGYVKTGVSNNVKYYEVVWLLKVQFAVPTDDGKTKQKSIQWNTPSIVGTISCVEGYKNDAYEEIAQFATEKEAIDYVNSLAGITA